METFSSSHPLQPYWQLAAAPLQTRALELALQHGLFQQLKQASTVQDVAQALAFDERATEVWLDMLWSMNLLTRTQFLQRSSPARYGLSPLAQQYFLQGASDDCAQAWQYRAGFLAQVARQMEHGLRHGATETDQAPVANPGSWAQAAQVQISQEQRAVTVPAVMAWLASSHLALPEQGRFLDLGGGPGHVGIALARLLPAWQGRVADLSDIVAIAQGNIVQAGMADRMEAMACNLDEDDLGEAVFDLIWCSSVLHFLHDPQAALVNMRQALKPGGCLLIAHAEIADDPALAARVLPFYAPMMWRGRYVPRAGDMTHALTQAGFLQVQSLGRADFPMAPVWAYVGYRA